MGSTDEESSRGPENGNRLEDILEKHRDKFEEKFKQDSDVPTHPYIIYRSIIENNELSNEERITLEHMKDEYAEKWQKLKQQHMASGNMEQKLEDGSKDLLYLEWSKSLIYLLITSYMVFTALKESIFLSIISMSTFIGVVAHTIDLGGRIKNE